MHSDKSLIDLYERMERMESRILSRLEESSKSKPQNPEPPLEYYNVKKAGEYLQLSPATIYTKVSRRELPRINGTHKLLFKKSDLDDYLNSARKKTIVELQEEAINDLSKVNRNGGQL